MPGPHKGISTQHTNQQQLAKPRHQPSDTDKQARDRLRNKAKIKSHACICHASARSSASQSTAPHFPSSLDGMRNRKARTGLIRWSAIIELHPQNWTRPHFGMQSLSQSEAFPPLSP